jgi:hypothetical protein
MGRITGIRPDTGRRTARGDGMLRVTSNFNGYNPCENWAIHIELSFCAMRA